MSMVRLDEKILAILRERKGERVPTEELLKIRPDTHRQRPWLYDAIAFLRGQGHKIITMKEGYIWRGLKQLPQKRIKHTQYETLYRFLRRRKDCFFSIKDLARHLDRTEKSMLWTIQHRTELGRRQMNHLTPIKLKTKLFYGIPK